MTRDAETTSFHPTHHVGKAAALALRLAEVENALHALTSGQVDAIIGPGGQTFLLRPAQEHLRQNEKQQQAVLESVADVLTVVSRSGVILSENHAVRRVLGYAPEELVGSVIFKLIHDTDMPAVYSAFVGVIEGYDEVDTIRFRHLMSDGSYCLVEATLGKLRDVSPASVVFSLRPITGSPAGVKSTVAESNGGQSPLGKDRFLAMLSHELRISLTPVLFGIAGLQKDERFSAALPSLAMIQRNVELQSRLLEGLDDFAAVGQHKVRLQLEPIDAHEIVRLALEVCSGEIAAAAIDIRLDLAASEHTVLADSLRLQQVMWNLVKNAVKFSARGSRVSIGSANDTTAGLVLEFADYGVGITPELLPLVFDPLQQGDDSMQRRCGGLGLGLFIARGLAEAHQGTLTVTSEGRGQGATFRLSLKTITQTT